MMRNVISMYFLLSVVLSISLLLLHHSEAVSGDSSDAKKKSLKDIWLQHKHPHYLSKWESYADHYEEHLPKPSTEKTIRLLEIGVQSGGSMPDWKEYYGEKSVIVGVDIDERCKRSEDKKQRIYIEIGSQLNTTFLQEVCDLYGPFDVIIDDGGHTDDMIINSMQFLYPNNQCLSIDGGVYAVEDLHTMVMKWYMKSHAAFTKKIISNAYASMHDYWDNQNAYTFDKRFQKNMVAIHLYDSIAFFVKRVPQPLKELIRGTDVFQNKEDKLNPPGSYGH